jgi:aspartate racemase
LFRAADRTEYPGMAIDSDLGWRRLVRGLLDIHELPGDHLGVLQSPNVEHLAEILGRRVRDAARAETSPGPASHAVASRLNS